MYLTRRGDANNVRTVADLIDKAKRFDDPQFGSKKAELEETNRARGFDTRNRLQRRFTIQQVVLQGMKDLELDALAYPTGNTARGWWDRPRRSFPWESTSLGAPSTSRRSSGSPRPMNGARSTGRRRPNSAAAESVT